MKIGNLEFNLRELAGSMGDFGTLLPLAIGSSLAELLKCTHGRWEVR